MQQNKELLNFMDFKIIYPKIIDNNNISSGNRIILEETEKYSRTLLDTDDLHGIGHTERVIIIAGKLLENEKGNPFVVFMAIWLHDIGRNKEKALKENHAIISAKIASTFLNKFKIDDEDKRNIIDSIECHSFSSGKTPVSIEAKIVSDADKIDALGAIGIYRASCYQYDHRTGIKGVINHFHEKLLILDKKIQTDTGKLIAKQRIDYMKEYKNQLILELM